MGFVSTFHFIKCKIKTLIFDVSLSAALNFQHDYGVNQQSKKFKLEAKQRLIDSNANKNLFNYSVLADHKCFF